MAYSVDDVPIDQIQLPPDSEQLHPVNDDKDGEWEDFKQSVGTSPIHPPLAKKNGDGYELIVGHRRVRAVQENGADTIDLRILEEGDEFEGKTKYTIRLAENYHRKRSDTKRRAEATAQVVAPWLLPPAERDPDVEWMSQPDFGVEVGIGEGKGASVSNWLNPLKDRYPIRHVLAQIANQNVKTVMDDEKLEQLDRIIQLLTGSNGHKVVATGEESWVADELNSFREKKDANLSLGEIEMMAEKSVDEGWNAETFLKETKSAFVPSATATTQKLKSGPLGPDGEVKEHEAESRTFDDGTDGGTVTPGDDPEPEPEAEPQPTFDEPNIEVNWGEYIDDDDLPGDLDVSTMKRRKYRDIHVEDDAAIGLQILAEVTNEEWDEIRRKFVEPLVTEAVVDFLADSPGDATE